MKELPISELENFLGALKQKEVGADRLLEVLLEDSEPFLSALSDQQRAIVEAIKTYCTRYGVPPTLQELGSSLNTSAQRVRTGLDALVKSGWLVRIEGRPHSNYVLSAAASLVCKEKPVSHTKKYNDPILNKLRDFMEKFPDNILSKLDQCKNAKAGALLIVNAVDDILAGN